MAAIFVGVQSRIGTGLACSGSTARVTVDQLCILKRIKKGSSLTIHHRVCSVDTLALSVIGCMVIHVEGSWITELRRVNLIVHLILSEWNFHLQFKMK